MPWIRTGWTPSARGMAARFLALLAIVAAALIARAASAGSEVDLIAEKLDTLYRSDASHSQMTMQITTKNYERALDMEVWTRGMDDTLVRIRAPRKEKGTSTLKKGREMWNFLPKIKKTIRVPPSMMMSGWMGSDLTNDDMVRESSWQRDYVASMLDQAARSEQKCVEFKAKSDAAVAWDRVVVCVDPEKYYPIRQDFYDEKGRHARSMTFSDVRIFSGREMPTRISVKPLLDDKKGNETVLVYRDIVFDLELDETLFSLARLRRGR